MVAPAKANELLEIIGLESCKHITVVVVCRLYQILDKNSLTMESLQKLNPFKQTNWMQIIYVAFLPTFVK